MSRIFISYRRADSIATAGRLSDRLCREFGEKNIFIDVDNIPAGVDFVDYIQDKVAACDALLAIIGPGWLNSRDHSGERRIGQDADFVSLEISAALERQVRVIPILVDGAVMPSLEDLPAALKGLSSRQAVEVRNTQFHQDAGRVVQRLRETLRSKPRGALGLSPRLVTCVLIAATILGAIAAVGLMHRPVSAIATAAPPALPAGFALADFREVDRLNPPACAPEISSRPEPVPIAFEGLANLALLKQARASASSVIFGFPGRHQVRFANDGWYNNCRSWIPATLPAWVEIDLGDVFYVSAIRIGSEHTAFWRDRAPTNFEIALRRDGDSPWTAVYTQDRTKEAVRETTFFRFPGRNAQYVRVTLTGTDAHDLPRLDEVEVYGEHIP